jgi:hypothetical protein
MVNRSGPSKFPRHSRSLGGGDFAQGGHFGRDSFGLPRFKSGEQLRSLIARQARQQDRGFAESFVRGGHGA